MIISMMWSLELFSVKLLETAETFFCKFQKWPETELHIIPDAGHSAKEVGIVSALVEATDKYKAL